MGGRIAEERYTKHLTTGAGNDIERATELARKMVCEWGMSELGPLSFGKKEEQIFLGREIAQHRDYSEETAIKIDEQVRLIVDQAFHKAQSVIEEYAWALEKIAAALLERETIDGAEVKALIQGEPSALETASSDVPLADESQQVIRPEGGLRPAPGFIEGTGAQPA